MTIYKSTNKEETEKVKCWHRLFLFKSVGLVSSVFKCSRTTWQLWLVHLSNLYSVYHIQMYVLWWGIKTTETVIKAFLLRLCLQSTKNFYCMKRQVFLWQTFEKPSGFEMKFAKKEGREAFTAVHLWKHYTKSHAVTSNNIRFEIMLSVVT